MLELKIKLLSTRTKPNPAIKIVSFDICDPFLVECQRITELAYEKLKNLSHIFYSGGRSLFAGLTAYTGANSELVYQFYKFEYLDIIYPDKNITELFYFRHEMENVLRTFHQKSILVKFLTSPREKMKRLALIIRNRLNSSGIYH